PSGTVTDAAVNRCGLKGSPLVVMRPANPGPYHDASTSWAMGVGAMREPETAGIAFISTGCDAAGAGVNAYPVMANERLIRACWQRMLPPPFDRTFELTQDVLLLSPASFAR